MRLWIGTAGYAYPAWAGGFYPPGTPQADYLSVYARHFPAVEINSSFYRPPTVPRWSAWPGGCRPGSDSP